MTPADIERDNAAPGRVDVRTVRLLLMEEMRRSLLRARTAQRHRRRAQQVHWESRAIMANECLSLLVPEPLDDEALGDEVRTRTELQLDAPAAVRDDQDGRGHKGTRTEDAR